MFKKVLRVFAILLLVVIAILPLGCGPFWVNPYFTVRDSSLNWVEIHYYNMNRTPIRRIGVYINGMGHVELRKGTSELVSNDFAKKHEDRNWEKIKTQKTMHDPAHIHEIFQNLVNYGLFDLEKTGRATKKKKLERFIAVKANINNYTYSKQENIFEVDPDLADQLYDVVREFDNPTL